MSVLVLDLLAVACKNADQQESSATHEIRSEGKFNATKKLRSRVVKDVIDPVESRMPSAEENNMGSASPDNVEQLDEIVSRVDESRFKRQAFKEFPLFLWKSLEVPYKFDKNLSKRAQSAFRKAARLWMNFTCINITEVEDDEGDEEIEENDDNVGEEGDDYDGYYNGDYSYEDLDNEDEEGHENNDGDEDYEDGGMITVQGGEGCSSIVGRVPLIGQNITLGRKCETIGTAAHELAHTLGLIHTHERHDRDEHITVNESNIQEGYRSQFERRSNESYGNYDVPYDYGSVMQYGTRAGSENRTKQTMVPKDELYTQTLGSLLVSFYDLLMMNTLYHCTDRCENHSSTKCKNHGFPHPRKCSECICPSGYGGQFCEERQPICGEEVNATSNWALLVTANSSAMTYGSQDGYKKCAYWIKAPNGSHVEVRLRKLPENVAKEGCILGGVEIKIGKDQGLTGYRFCSSSDVNLTLTSNTSTLPVLTYMRRRRNDTAIELEYRIANETKEEVK